MQNGKLVTIVCDECGGTGTSRDAYGYARGCRSCDRRGRRQVFEDKVPAGAKIIVPVERTVVILDQFFGPSPYELQQEPMKWAAFVEDVEHGKYTNAGYVWRRPEIKTVQDDGTLRAAMATTWYTEDENGNVKVFMANWDSSG